MDASARPMPGRRKRGQVHIPKNSRESCQCLGIERRGASREFNSPNAARISQPSWFVRGDLKGDRYIFPRFRENPASVWGLSSEERVANSTLPTPLGAANRLSLFVGSFWIRMHTEVCGPVGEVIRVGLVSPRGLASPSGRLAWLGGVDRRWGALRSTSGLRQTSLFGVGRAGIRGLPASVCLFWARARYSTERGLASGFCDEPTGAVRNRNGP